MSALPLPADRVTEYREKGFVIVPAMITPEQVQELMIDYDRAVDGEYGYTDEQGDKPNRSKSVQLGNPSEHIPHWRQHDYFVKILTMARQLEGEDIEFAYDQIIMKPPHHPAETQWHQDAGYWRRRDLANTRAITCWLALSHVFPENGAVSFVPGSHKGKIAVHEDASARSEIGHALEIPGVDMSQAVTVTLEPGDATFHHCRTFHFAGGNNSDVVRRGLTTHFFPQAELEARPVKA